MRAHRNADTSRSAPLADGPATAAPSGPVDPVKGLVRGLDPAVAPTRLGKLRCGLVPGPGGLRIDPSRQRRKARGLLATPADRVGLDGAQGPAGVYPTRTRRDFRYPHLRLSGSRGDLDRVRRRVGSGDVDADGLVESRAATAPEGQREEQGGETGLHESSSRQGGVAGLPETGTSFPAQDAGRSRRHPQALARSTGLLAAPERKLSTSRRGALTPSYGAPENGAYSDRARSPMGLIQIRFEDATSSATVYGLWEDEETPAVLTILASLQDGLRVREGAGLVHAGWHRALAACRESERRLSGRPLAERHAAARGLYLSGGPLAASAADVAGLLLSYDATHFRPYPTGGAARGDDHGIGTRPHLTVRVDRVDHGDGLETVLTIRPTPDEGLLETFDKPLAVGGDLGNRWSGGADLALARRIRALAPFGPALTRVELASDGFPTVITRLDAATVAVAHARLLGMPLPVALPLQASLPPSPPKQDPPARALGPGRLVVRFRHGAALGTGLPATTLVLERDGDRADLPDLLARLAALPLLPLALEGTGDRTARHLSTTEDLASGLIDRESGDPADLVRALAGLLPHGALPRACRAPQDYAALLFAAEPGLWHVRPDGAPGTGEADVTVLLEQVPSDDRIPGPSTTCLAILPATRHAAALGADPRLAEHVRLLTAWGTALAPLRLSWIRFEARACAFSLGFEEAGLAVACARIAGFDLPAETPYGPRPFAGSPRRQGRIPALPNWEPEALLAPAELALQRRAREELALAAQGHAPDTVVGFAPAD